MRAATGRREVRLGDLIWIGAGILFLGVRLSAAIELPVHGAELPTLAGAWQESLGHDDPRFIGSLFQAITGLLLRLDGDVALPRALALAASATVPFSIWLMRRELGEPAALVLLLLVSLDPLAVLFGSTANGSAFDVAVSLCLLAAVLRGSASIRIWAALGFLVAAGGPAPVLLAGAVGAHSLVRRRSLNRRAAGALLVGAAGALVLLSLAFARAELRVPPLDLLAAGLSEEWAGARVLELTVLYETPTVLFGAAAAANSLTRLLRTPNLMRSEQLLLAWAAAGGLYWAAAGGSHDPSVLLSLTLPLSGLIALAAARLDAFWPTVAGGWARILGAVGLALGTAAGFALLLSGTFAVGRGATNEPLISPRESASTAALRDHVLRLARERAGGVVVHPDLQESVTWPFRSSVTLLVSPVVPRGDSVVIWPAEAPAPADYEDAGGTWFLVRTISPPGNDLSKTLEWFRHRNRQRTEGLEVRVYTGATP